MFRLKVRKILDTTTGGFLFPMMIICGIIHKYGNMVLVFMRLSREVSDGCE